MIYRLILLSVIREKASGCAKIQIILHTSPVCTKKYQGCPTKKGVHTWHTPLSCFDERKEKPLFLGL